MVFDLFFYCVTVKTIYTLYEYYEVFSHPDYAIMFAVNFFLVPQLVFLVGARELSPVEISEINEKENKNVADGLAWSYYFGYLELVLPRLEYQITKSPEFRYKIIKKKLFILLPKNCQTYDDIVKADNRVECVGSLSEYLTNRAGVQSRSYKHSVHRIEMPSPDGQMKEYHFILEYATPLRSLYDMSRHGSASLSRQERDHQVVLFIRKLKEILDASTECKDKYELVPISGEETNKIADVLVGIHDAVRVELDKRA